MKKFNPKKCPYIQLLKHNGDAQIFLVFKSEGTFENDYEDTYEVYGIREMKNNSFYISYWDSFLEKFPKGQRSCFIRKFASKLENITAMIKCDYSDDVRISHIEFFPKGVLK